MNGAWLDRVTRLLDGLRQLKDLYVPASGHKSRSTLGMAGVETPGRAWSSTYPHNPFPYPWAGGQGPEGPALAVGLFEGHMRKLTQGFRLVREAELELSGQYNPAVHEALLAGLDWRSFTDEEFGMCPPLIISGGDAALAASGGGPLMHLMSQGRPLKVLCLDTQAWAPLTSAPPSIFPGERVWRGDAALAAIVRRNIYVWQGGLADLPAMIRGFMDGLSSRHPAWFHVFCESPSRSGAPADLVSRSRLALASRAHPALCYNPTLGQTPHECLRLEGNPDPADDWTTRELKHTDGTGPAKSDVEPLTFAGFALAIPELRHHFRPLRSSQPSAKPVPLHQYIDLDAEERVESTPVMLAVNHQGRLERLEVSTRLAAACAERRAYWRLLRTLTRQDIIPVDEEAIAKRARAEVVDTVWQQLLDMARSGESLAKGLEQAAQAGGAHA